MRAHFSRPAALCLAAALLGCGGAEERKAEHLTKAIGFFEAQNPEKAAIEFKNVLQIDPKSAKPYYYLGRIEEGKKNWPQAFGFYQKAVELDPNDLDARYKLAQFFTMGRDAEKAAETLEPVAKQRPTDLDVRMMQAAIANLKGDGLAALAQLQAIVLEKPARPDPYMALAAMYSQQSRLADAEDVIKTGIAANPKSAPLLATLARLYVQQKQWDKAGDTERELIAADAKEFRFRLMLAETYLMQSRWSDAEQTLRTAVRDFPATPQPVLTLAEFLTKRSDAAGAESELRAAVASHPEEIDLRVALANLMERIHRPDQAEQVFRDFIAANETKPDAVKARVLLAELLARQGKTAQSEALVSGVLSDNPQNNPALMLKGRLALGKKNAQDAIAAFRSILKDQPDSAEATTLLASAFQLDGKPALVQENLDKAARLKPQDFGIRRNLIQFLIQQNNLSLALEQANDFLKLQPDSVEGWNIKADVLYLNKQTEALESLLKEMKNKFPGKPIGSFRLGKFYQEQKKYEAAVSEYESALRKASNDYEVLKALVAVYLELKQPAKAEAQLRKALADDPKQAGAHALLGTLALRKNQGEEAVKAFEKAIELDPEWLPPYVELGSYFERRGKLDRAIAVMQRATEAAPDDWPMRAALAGLLEKSRKPDQAERIYRDFIAAHEGQPDTAKARSQLAEFLARSGRFDESRSLMEAALANNPQDRDALLRKARLAIADRRPQEAITLSQSLLKDRPDSVDALTLLAAAYRLDGKPGEAFENFEKAIRVRPSDPALRKNFIQFLVEQKNLPAALAQSEDFLKLQPGNLEGLNLRADLLALDKQHEPLEALLKEIKQRFPDNALAAFRLGTFYQNHGRYDDALAEFDIALQKSGNAYEPLKGITAVHLELKQPAKADARLRKVLAGNPKHAGAYQLLGALALLQNHAEEGIRNLNKAIELSPAWLPPYMNLASHYERSGQPELAIAVYRKAQSAVPGDPSAALGLARAHEAAKQYSQAIAEYEAVLKAHPDNVVAVNNLATLLSAPPADAADLKRALGLAQRLESTGEPAFLDTLAWIYHLSGDSGKALPLQEKVVEQAPDVPVFHYHLGMIYAKQGNSEQARIHLAKALESKMQFPGSDDAKIALQSLQ